MSISNPPFNRVSAYLFDASGVAFSSTNPVPVSSGFTLPKYDYDAVTYPLSTREVYTFKTGGSGGTTVATITINYTDATKASLLNVAKT